jgi:hypothetical protein
MTSSVNSFFAAASTKISSLFPSSQEDGMKEIPPFKASEWASLGLDVEAIEIPEKLLSKLNSPCPLQPDKLIKETHVCCLIPKGMTLEKLYELNGRKSACTIEGQNVIKEPYWVLLTMETIPPTNGLDFELQKVEVSKKGYAAPRAVEVAIGVLAARQLGNVSLFPERKDSTNCQEEFKNEHIVIGSDDIAIFSTHANNWDVLIGMAGVIRFHA